MNFRRRGERDEPDINLIPMIDILLVVLIFLMITTTYVKPSALKVNLPTAETGDAPARQEASITLRVSAQGQYAVDTGPGGLSREQLAQALKTALNGRAAEAVTVRIEADAATSHQSVVMAMDVAGSLGLKRISMVTARK